LCPSTSRRPKAAIAGRGEVRQLGQDHHRGADRPDHLRDRPHRHRGGEVPPEADDRDLEQDQPQPAGEEKASELGAGAAGARDPCARAGAEDEDRRAEVGDPAGGEQRQVSVGEVGGVEPGLGEVGPDVIEHHNDHDQAAQQIHVVQAPAAGGGLGLRRAGRPRPLDPVCSGGGSG